MLFSDQLLCNSQAVADSNPASNNWHLRIEMATRLFPPVVEDINNIGWLYNQTRPLPCHARHGNTMVTVFSATKSSPDQQTLASLTTNPCRYPTMPGVGGRGLCGQKRQPVLPPNAAGIGMLSIHRFSAFWSVSQAAKTCRVEGLLALPGSGTPTDRSEPFPLPQATVFFVDLDWVTGHPAVPALLLVKKKRPKAGVWRV
ncbi:uncharacterized protein B0H64DRAFT_383874 [Chaetomium fimeti]|uniref:Uncharacterized protein n=1 Tax=Chaetomium fimeti TaxID=1854472 RepID=A0AAE0HRS5_9PEZI|nr:hypothetical protein B0H64DRAFT_383874 [Chaetomium fimeti]